MLRRVARVLRFLLLLAGTLTLLLLAVSWFVGVEITSPWPPDITNIGSRQGTVLLVVTDHQVHTVPSIRFRLELTRLSPYELNVTALWPSVRRLSAPRLGFTQVELSLPHWLLALICLAWPVTSFIIHRRRHKRGFPVIQPEVSGQKSEVSSEAPKVRSNEAQGASPG